MDRGIDILKWYPFEKGATILEIYEDNSILKKLDKKINLTSCPIQELQLEGEYDYITLLGTYEYAPIIYQGKMPYIEFLQDLKKHLKSNGKILLAIDNRLGIKYLAGAKSKHYNKIFEGIGREIRKNKPNLLLKKELEYFIKETGFQNYKFYYPLPDYKNTSCIFTDDFLPKSSHSKILYPTYYEEGSMIIYNEIDAMRQICDNGTFVEFTNSYLIEISNEKIKNDIKFVNYNIFRKEKYKLMLTINQNSVVKLTENDKAKEHIKQIEQYISRLRKLGFEIIEKVENEKILSNFMTADELDKKIVQQIKQGNLEQAYQEIEKWYQYIKERLEKEEVIGENVFEKYKIQIPQEIQDKMHFIKSGFIDLLFENIFYENDKYYFYDQEWCIENIPLEFILYRAINNLYTYNVNRLSQVIERKELLKKFDLNEFEDYFIELEKIIQEQILEKEIIERYKEQMKQYSINLEELNHASMKNNIESVPIQDYKNLEEEKVKIETNYQKLLQEYNTSRGWKLIKLGRKLLGKNHDVLS